jgi:predicted DNA-binding protein
MPRMKRKQIYLEPDQDRRLRVLARRRGKTESQLIREGVNRILQEPVLLRLNHKAWEEESAFIASLIRKGPIKGKRTWRRQDIYERR